jgi:acyl-homoserine lactone acylase PvdQ
MTGRLHARPPVRLLSLLILPLLASHSPRSLADDVTIYRDRYGVPHVYGRTDAATVFGFAYAQAEDHFRQLEENFIRATGRLAEKDQRRLYTLGGGS